jgi:hypothetical protein
MMPKKGTGSHTPADARNIQAPPGLFFSISVPWKSTGNIESYREFSETNVRRNLHERHFLQLNVSNLKILSYLK